jgi:hypothetical protein
VLERFHRQSAGKFSYYVHDANGELLTSANLPNFEAQARTDLVNWTTLPNALSLTNGMLLWQDPFPANLSMRFYRILEHGSQDRHAFISIQIELQR